MLLCSLLAAVAPAGGSAFAQSATFQTDAVPIEAETIVDGLQNPWGLDFLPNGEAIVTERPGRVRILSRDGRLSEPLGGVPEVAARGQGGLLDIVAAPDFASSNLVFFSFSEPGRGGAGTAVARAKLVRDGGSARLDDVEVIFSMAKKTNVTRHFGSRLVFSPDGTLFVTTGDRGVRNRAQDMQDHAARSSASILTARSPRQPLPRRRETFAGNLVQGPPQRAGRGLGPRARRTRSPSSTATRAETRSTIPKPARITAGR